jgi:D-glycero-D-manno-heptose 1,7-bisphosphate phosphatase
MNSQKSRALFLDRDGVINEDSGYLYKIDDFKFIDGIFEVLEDFKKRGYIFIVITNQSGIGRGYYTQKDFYRLTDWMVDEFKKRDIEIKRVYFCPHLPNDGCNCRKPKTGLFLKAKEEFDIDMENSVMIGDKDSDMRAAKDAGIKNRIIIKNSSKNATKSVDNLREILRM